MKRTLATLCLATALAGGAFAQTAPVGGSDAKGNSPVKAVHTVNNGSAKPAANSFTRGQAMKHIENSGYSGVSGLTMGRDGVWRGTAMKNGAPVNVAMDFKGNVTEGMAPVAGGRMVAPPASAPPMRESAVSAAPAAAGEMATTGVRRHGHHWRHRHWRRHRRGAEMGCNTDPGPNGVACSGRDRNKNGVSDKEDRATGSH